MPGVSGSTTQIYLDSIDTRKLDAATTLVATL